MLHENHSPLALLGGKKTLLRKGPHFSWPPITPAIERQVLRQLRQNISIYDRSGIFEKFEKAFAVYHQRRFALLCNSGTTAIHSMMVAAGLKAGDEIICPAYTFFATVTPVLFTGVIPVLCDCDENGNIDPLDVEKKITKRTKALIITHMWGIPCQMDRITAICKERKIILMEDCSHAHGGSYGGRPLGSFGDLSAWSLQGQKIITGGEGGIMTTNEKEFYYRALLLGHYNKRCLQEIPKAHPLYGYGVTGMGLKYRAHPLAVTIAYELFKKLHRFQLVKKRIALNLLDPLTQTGALKGPKLDELMTPSWYALVFQYQSDRLGHLPLERFLEAILAEGLKEVDHPGSTKPLHLLRLFQNPQELFPVYHDHPFSYQPGDFPMAEQFYRNAIKIPVWANLMDRGIVRSYVRGIQKVINHYHDLQ